jgi:hypothetical protein
MIAPVQTPWCRRKPVSPPPTTQSQESTRRPRPPVSYHPSAEFHSSLHFTRRKRGEAPTLDHPPESLVPTQQISLHEHIRRLGTKEPPARSLSGSSAAGALEPHLTLRSYLESPTNSSQCISGILSPIHKTNKCTESEKIHKSGQYYDNHLPTASKTVTPALGERIARPGLIFTSPVSKSLTFNVSSLVCRPNAGLMRAGFSVSRHQGFAHGQGGHHQGQAGFQC